MRLVSIVLLTAFVLAGCGGSSRSMHLSEGAQRLTEELHAQRVDVGRGMARPRPLGAAWTAFRHLAAVPIAAGDLSAAKPNDGLVFEFRVSTEAAWGRTLEVAFARQLATPGGELEQIRLTAHYPPALFAALKSELAVAVCGPAQQCAARCAFTGDRESHLLAKHCTVARGRPSFRTRTLEEQDMWSTDVGGPMRWYHLVEGSPVFRALVSRETRPLGYEVSLESPE